MKKLSLLILCITTLLSAASQFERLADQFEGKDSVKQYNPALTTSLSLIPGGGQLYTRHFTRGGLFLGMEMLMGSQSLMRWNWYHQSFRGRDQANHYYDSLADFAQTKGTISKPDSILLLTALHTKKLKEFETEKYRIDWINWSGWFAGIYAWNLIDGLGCSNQFDGIENPSPKRAAWLSAIPFTGAGQFYNGQFFKGAMFSTMQLGCLYSAINFNRVMKNAEEYENELTNLPDSAYNLVSVADRQAWRSRYDSALRSRTMFMWYGVIFYLYGVADGAIDAHLHDFERHFRISGNVDPVDNRISFNLDGTFGKKR